MNWFGVMPAVTTPFDKDLKVDHEFLARHSAWLLENGCTGLVHARFARRGRNAESMTRRSRS